MFDDMNKCQYPNLAAEIHEHRHSYATFATHGNITSELLQAFLKGDEKITQKEAYGMVVVSNGGANVKLSPNYLLAPKFAYYDMNREKHKRKVMMILRRCNAIRQSVNIEKLCVEGKIRRSDQVRLLRQAEPLLTAEQAIEYRYIGRIAINRALRFIAELESLPLQTFVFMPRDINTNAAIYSNKKPMQINT